MTDYCTVAELKSSDHLNVIDGDSDVVLGDIIGAVSNWIDSVTGRLFGVTAVETRYFTSTDSRILFCDDISTATGLVIQTDDDADGTFENTWAANDYTLRPYNPKNGWPYEAIEVNYYGARTFPRHKRGVKIQAAFGFAAVPDPIKQACLLQSERLFKRMATPLGSSGMSAVGEVRLQIPAADGDVKALLEPFMRLM